MGRHDSTTTQKHETKETGGMTEVQMRKSGRYYWPPDGGEALPSVTTITKNLDKSGGLVGSAVKISATYAVEKVLEWEDLPPDDAIRLIKKQHREEWDFKRDRGSAAHKAIEKWLRADRAGDVEPEVDINMLPYLAGAISFVTEQVEKVGAIETTIFNLTYKYAGTADALVQLNDGNYAIVDWKTGNVYDEQALQVAAYAHGQFIGKPDGTEIPLDRPITRGIVVQLPGDGTYAAHVAQFACGGKCELRKECPPFRAFIGLRSVQKWTDKAKKTSFVDKQTGGGTPQDDAA
jgi:hypothetical protein